MTARCAGAAAADAGDERLYVDSPPLGTTKLSNWVRASCRDVGRRYTSELQRRLDRVGGYRSN